jgi:predicted secreted protein
MNWYTAIVAFTIIWWMVLFMVLPIGVRTAADEQQEAGLGHAASAPLLPRLGFKFALTTLISLVLLGIFWMVVQYDLFGMGAWLRS